MAQLEEWEAGLDCPSCGGPTLAPNPGGEELGDYCPSCGRAYVRDYRPAPRPLPPLPWCLDTVLTP